MVPCLDMANHSHMANAYYERTADGSVALFLKPDTELNAEEEVTISYGSSKSAAEMLFSYGFIDEQSATNGIALTLEPFQDDPLGKAKTVAFSGPPIVRITLLEDSIKWESPFLYMLCLNEEDGLEFKVLQETDGSRSSLRVFWQDSDVTEETDSFENLVSSHELADIFRLRVVAILHERIREQLGLLYDSEETVQSLASIFNSGRHSTAFQLRVAETRVLEKAFAAVDVQVSYEIGEVLHRS
jgi:hypothetical protein